MGDRESAGASDVGVGVAAADVPKPADPERDVVAAAPDFDGPGFDAPEADDLVLRAARSAAIASRPSAEFLVIPSSSPVDHELRGSFSAVSRCSRQRRVGTSKVRASHKNPYPKFAADHPQCDKPGRCRWTKCATIEVFYPWSRTQSRDTLGVTDISVRYILLTT